MEKIEPLLPQEKSSGRPWADNRHLLAAFGPLGKAMCLAQCVAWQRHEVDGDGRRSGVPLGSQLASASPAEVTLAESTLRKIAVPQKRGAPRRRPLRVIADAATTATRCAGDCRNEAFS